MSWFKRLKRSVYYSSFIKTLVSTLLVCKKCQYKLGIRGKKQAGLGIKVHKVFGQRLLIGLSVPFKWALGDQVSGIDRPNKGYSLPIARARSAQSVGRFLGTSCGSAASLFCMMLYGDFVMLRWWFLWYFLWFYDTSMILLVKQSKKYHSCILLCIRYLCWYLTKKMILWDFFSRKKIVCEYGRRRI